MENKSTELVAMIAEMTPAQFEWFKEQVLLLLSQPSEQSARR